METTIETQDSETAAAAPWWDAANPDGEIEVLQHDIRYWLDVDDGVDLDDWTTGDIQDEIDNEAHDDIPEGLNWGEFAPAQGVWVRWEIVDKDAIIQKMRDEIGEIVAGCYWNRAGIPEIINRLSAMMPNFCCEVSR